jgi:hypothetical protein
MDPHSVDRRRTCVHGCAGIMPLLVMVAVAHGFRRGSTIMWTKGSSAGMKHLLLLKEAVMKCGITLLYVGDTISWRKCRDRYEAGNIS